MFPPTNESLKVRDPTANPQLGLKKYQGADRRGQPRKTLATPPTVQSTHVVSFSMEEYYYLQRSGWFVDHEDTGDKNCRGVAAKEMGPMSGRLG